MIGTIINGRYELLQTLSESHQFEVFTALERETGATVVVKLLREELCDNQERVQIFCEEVKAFAALSHPGIVHILDMDQFGRRPFVVTELVEGIDLKTWMQSGTASFKDVGRVVQELAAVLQYACDQKVTRRSIKVSNVFRRRDGSIKVLTFSHPRLKLVGAESRRYDEAAGVQSDLFFLGTTMFELLTGESPIRKRGGLHELWESRLRQALRVRHAHLTPDDIDRVVDFLDRTLTRNVQRRFESHAAFLMGLSDLLHASEGALRKERGPAARVALATAAEVVDAIHGRLPGVSVGSIGSARSAAADVAPLAIGRQARQAVSSARLGSEAAASPGAGAAMLAVSADSGGAALAISAEAEPLPAEPAPDLEEDAPPASSPRLTVVSRLGRPAATSQIWRKAEEQTRWWRNPLFLMGGLLLLMIILILFW